MKRSFGSLIRFRVAQKSKFQDPFPSVKWRTTETLFPFSPTIYSAALCSSKSSAHDPACLNLSGSAGSQAAQAAIIGALATTSSGAATEQLDSSYKQGGKDSQVKREGSLSAEETHRHEGNVSLHSAMQSSVPQPYEHDNRSPNHMNMPAGGQLREFDANEEVNEAGKVEKVTGEPAMSQKERMKKAVKEYGATVIIFHTSISLCTLGIAYAAVSSGVDVIGLLEKAGVGQSILESKIATGASTFVVAYAAHKVFAPVRMAITLSATPFIVHYLRRIGMLKPSAPKA